MVGYFSESTTPGKRVAWRDYTRLSLGIQDVAMIVFHLGVMLSCHCHLPFWGLSIDYESNSGKLDLVLKRMLIYFIVLHTCRI